MEPENPITPKVRLIDSPIPAPGELVPVAEGIFWLRMPLPLALDHINLYLVEEADGWTLIDTGMNLPDTVTLWEEIFARYFAEKPLKQIVVTHLHPDHIGLAGYLEERWRCPLYMSQAEYFAARSYTAADARRWRAEQYYRECGLGEDFVATIGKRMGFRDIVSTLPGSFRQLRDGDLFPLAGSRWQVILGSGHSPAHVCLYSPERKLLLAGDQILSSISPNVSVMASEPEASPLPYWFASLERLRSLASDTLVLPAHGKPFTGIHTRVDELLHHHQERLAKLLGACVEWKSPLALMKPLFGREIPQFELSLAIGECKAHLHYLRDQGLLSCELKNGVEHYLAATSITPQEFLLRCPPVPARSFQTE